MVDPSPAEHGAGRAVLLVGDALGHGGVEAYIVQLANRLSADGYAVTVQAIGGGPLWDRLDDSCERMPVPKSNLLIEALLRARATRRHARAHPGLVVHAHQRIVAFVSWLALRGRNDAVVVEHVHNVFESRGLVRWASFRSDVLIACGTRVGEMLVERFGRPRSRVRVVLNGVPPAMPAQQASGPGDRDASAAALRIVNVGRLSEQKDPVRFVRVVDALVRSAPELTIRASWVGGGPLEARVEEEVRRRGLGGAVTLVGQVADAAPYIAQADVLLMTSAWEGLPLVALESLSLGRGVVLPDVGSCVDAVADGEVGEIYAPTDPDEAVARRVLSAFRSGALAQWSERARRVHRERFDYDRMVREIEEVYAGARRR